jgi:hypothetical protein
MVLNPLTVGTSQAGRAAHAQLQRTTGRGRGLRGRLWSRAVRRAAWRASLGKVSKPPRRARVSVFSARVLARGRVSFSSWSEGDAGGGAGFPETRRGTPIPASGVWDPGPGSGLGCLFAPLLTSSAGSRASWSPNTHFQRLPPPATPAQ